MNRQLSLLLLCVPLLLGCARPPAEPCPGDQALIARFQANEAAFEKLLADPANTSLHAQLGIQHVHGEARVHFAAWHLDFPGPGGVVKGYAYAREQPGALVDSIDANSDPGSAEVKTIYRRIRGDWYLYYSSSN